MSLKFNTIDDFDFNGKTVLLRVDINSPVDPNSGIILDDSRMQTHSETIKELSKKGAKVVILAHQSRPGKKDFTTLKQHSKALAEILAIDVNYIDDIFGSSAKEAINFMENGDILLLENVRFYSEESLNRDPKAGSNTHLVKELSPFVDYFVNDAFATAHRSQTSLVGFTLNTPSLAGRVMEKELKILNRALDTVERPCIFVLGGMKADDSINVIENVLKNGTADFVLTTGLIANIFLQGDGVNIGEINKDFIAKRGYLDMVIKATNLLESYGSQILYPKDVAVSIDGNRLDVSIEEIPNKPILDIGSKTIKEYAKEIRKAKTIFANGPAGVFEDSKFAIGTDDLLNAIANSPAFTIIGGGHAAAATVSMGFADNMDHISTGGGASINLLAGEELPAVCALNNAYRKI
ncbi:MAG: phosphoglycerate kinase [Methanobacteriaceae archaeon]